MQQPYEIVFVDDGSRDDSLTVLQSLKEGDPDHLVIVQLRRNYGKTAALVAGFQAAQGEILITMDADLQDDPEEIPGMVAELAQGSDLVAAWRKQRSDSRQKRLSSWLFNKAVAALSGIKLQDLNCGFKVYRREVIESVKLYSDLHRFIPILAVWKGFTVTERAVNHHPRHTGTSKYGPGRVARGITDLLMVLFITRYLRYPLRLFGWLGIFVFTGGGAINFYLACLWMIRFFNLAPVEPIGSRPLFAVGILAMILGVQLISIGLLGEMVRYFAYHPEQEYAVRRIW